MTSAIKVPPFQWEGVTVGFNYQPAFAADGNVAYYEMLARPKKNHRKINTGGFISHVEGQGTGATFAFDSLVLRHAVRTLEAYPDCRLGINVSGITVDTWMWSEQAANSRVIKNPKHYSRLVLEITETKPIRDIQQTLSFINWWKQKGGKVALDDFGAPNTEFHLNAVLVRQLKPDFVKLDHSVISDPPRLRSMLRQLGPDLGSDIKPIVIIEGIEDKSLIERLSTIKERPEILFQGYVAGPLPHPTWHPSPRRNALRRQRQHDLRT